MYATAGPVSASMPTIRYFGSVDRQYLLEDPDVDIRGDPVLHLRYRVRR